MFHEHGDLRERTFQLGRRIARLFAALPARNLGLDRRGLLKEGMFADLVAFDPLTAFPGHGSGLGRVTSDPS